MPEAAVNTPAVIEDRGIPAHCERTGKHDDAGRRRLYGQPCPAAVIDAGVEIVEWAAIVRAPVAKRGGNPVRVVTGAYKRTIPEFLWAGAGDDCQDLVFFWF